MADPDFPKGAPVHLRLLARQSDHAAVDVRGRLRPQTSHHPPDLHGRAGIAPLAKHLVEPRGAQARILREGVADERQKRVEGTRAAHPAARAARLMLQRRAHRLMVDAEGGRDGPDLPMLADIEAPDLGALRGRDHHSSSGRRGATAPGSATGSPGRRPDSASDRGPAPGGRQGRGVWRTGRRRGKRDPSRGTGRDRRVDGLGDRGALPDCADGGPGRPAPSAGGPGSGNAPRSRRGHGRTPDRSRRGGRTSGRSFGGGGGGAGPRGRSPRGDFRLDGEPKPWHNSSDWLGLSEFEAVTRVRRHPGPHLVCVPPVRYPKDRVDTTAGAMDAAAGADAHDAPTPACKTARRAVSHKRPQPVIFLLRG